MPVSLEPILPHIPAFLMVLFRLSGIFMFAPLFGSNLIPMRIKVLLALTLSFCIYPMIPPQVPMELSVATIAGSIGSELLIGLAIGYGASIPLIAMQLGGLLMGQQLGLAIANVLNPDFDEQVSIFGQLLFLAALTIFLLLDGHHALIGVLINSFNSVPLGGLAPGGEILAMTVGLLTAMFELAVRVAAPLLCLVFLETVAMGFIAKTVPQIQIFSLGFPIRILLGLFLTIVVCAVMFDALVEEMRYAIGLVSNLFGGG